MKEAIIVDTGYWIALFDSRDTNHAVAKRNLNNLLMHYRLYVTDLTKPHAKIPASHGDPRASEVYPPKADQFPEIP